MHIVPNFLGQYYSKFFTPPMLSVSYWDNKSHQKKFCCCTFIYSTKRMAWSNLFGWYQTYWTPVNDKRLVLKQLHVNTVTASLLPSQAWPQRWVQWRLTPEQSKYILKFHFSYGPLFLHWHCCTDRKILAPSNICLWFFLIMFQSGGRVQIPVCTQVIMCYNIWGLN